MEHMPNRFPPHTGVCISCGQHWSVDFPAFDIYCPRCHALVMRRGAFHRATSALLMGGVLVVFGGLLTLALVSVAGTPGLVGGIAITAMASVSGAVWTYRAVRAHRTVAQPLEGFSRGLARP
jgi:predicted RNA-binding Zn-ribbon protein involved in translation (DUF1610 family)